MTIGSARTFGWLFVAVIAGGCDRAPGAADPSMDWYGDVAGDADVPDPSLEGDAGLPGDAAAVVAEPAVHADLGAGHVDPAARADGGPDAGMRACDAGYVDDGSACVLDCGYWCATGVTCSAAGSGVRCGACPAGTLGDGARCLSPGQVTIGHGAATTTTALVTVILEEPGNAIVNGGAESAGAADGWTMGGTGGDGWGATSGLFGERAWVTSYGWDGMSQRASLVDAGYSPAYIASEPPMTVRQWRRGSWPMYDDRYRLIAARYSSSGIQLGRYDSGNVAVTADWEPEEHVFASTAPTVREVDITFGGQDAEFLQGHHGSVIDGTVVTLGKYEMRLSRDATTWTDWMPFAPRVSWVLTRPGTNTVYVEYRGTDGVPFGMATDTIDLDLGGALAGFVSIDAGSAVAASGEVTLYAEAPANLLTNASNEDGSHAGWSVASCADGLAVTDGGIDGQYSVVHSSCSSTRTQTVDLLAMGYTAAELDTGRVSIRAHAFYTGVGPEYGDTYRLTLQALDGSGGVRGSFGGMMQVATGTWQSEQVVATLPAGTRHVRYVERGHDMEFWPGHYGTRVDGAYVGAGSWEVRFSNDGTTWGPWTAFAPSTSWSLAGSEGTQVVIAQFRDASGTVWAAIDSVER